MQSRYGIAIRTGEYYLAASGRPDLFWPLLILCLIVVLTCPVVSYVALTFAATGHTGLRSYESAGGSPELTEVMNPSSSRLPRTTVVSVPDAGHAPDLARVHSEDADP